VTRAAWLIESDPLFRAFLEQELERRKWIVKRSEDGIQAIEALGEVRNDSIVLLGASLTHVSSMQVLREIRSHPNFQKTTVFYLSNRYDPAIDYAAKRKSARVVYKPIDFAHLETQMAKVALRESQ
jgi:DNA-binding response OmpR family regulator